MADAVLKIEGLRAGYIADAPIIDDVSLDLHAGEILALLGTNGAGKSTVVKAIAGAIRPFAGSVLCGGMQLAGEAPWRIARAGIGYVPQVRNVFADLTVRENLAIGRAASRGRAHGDDMAAVLEQFPDLAARLGVRAGTLSGGMRQMVAIGRALLGTPSVLLLDEPAAGLSPKMAGGLFTSLTRLKRQVPILLVEQNIRAALAIADRVIIMAEGRARMQTTPAALLADATLTDSLLGGLA